MSDCVYTCPCDYYGDSIKPCSCASSIVTKYQKRISGPLLDRIDTAQPYRSAAQASNNPMLDAELQSCKTRVIG